MTTIIIYGRNKEPLQIIPTSSTPLAAYAHWRALVESLTDAYTVKIVAGDREIEQGGAVRAVLSES